MRPRIGPAQGAHSNPVATPRSAEPNAARRPYWFVSTAQPPNAALYLVFVTPMRGHQPTLDYLRRRKAEGNRIPEIIRCLNLMIESAHEIVANDPIFRILRGR